MALWMELKFVKGDAIASILILAINIIGGLIIGISQHDLPITIAAETYILLSIGDGLVAQIRRYYRLFQQL